MQVAVTRAYRSPGSGRTGLLALLGFGTGLALGFMGGSLFGAGGPRRVGRMVRAAGRSPAVRRAELLAAVRAALSEDPLLAREPIELHRLGTSGVELRGWVSSRALRARAHRAVHAAAPGERISNRLLVRGEDDSPVALVADDAPRSA